MFVSERRRAGGDLPRDGAGRGRAGRAFECRRVEPDQRAGPPARRAHERHARQDAARQRLSRDQGRRAPRLLLDLPGYGYARAQARPPSGRRGPAGGFEAIGRAVFSRGPAGLLLVDARHPGLESDRAAWTWMRDGAGDVAVVATKIDKLARGERIRALRESNPCLKHPVLPVSAVTGEGLDELWKLIDRLTNSRSRTAPAATRRAPKATAPLAPPEKSRALDAQGHERRRADQDRQGARRAGRDRHAQAGADLRDPEGAGREERPDLLRRRARSAAGRLRLPARAGLQLPAGPGRHLRLAVADPQVRSAHRRHRVRPDPAAQGRRALLRAAQGRSGQLRAAGTGAREDLLRQPDAALSADEDRARDRRREPVGARPRHDGADRQGPARPDRRAAAHRQDDAAAEHRQQHHARTTPRST